MVFDKIKMTVNKTFIYEYRSKLSTNKDFTVTPGATNLTQLWLHSKRSQLIWLWRQKKSSFSRWITGQCTTMSKVATKSRSTNLSKREDLLTTGKAHTQNWLILYGDGRARVPTTTSVCIRRTQWKQKRKSRGQRPLPSLFLQRIKQLCQQHDSLHLHQLVCQSKIRLRHQRLLKEKSNNWTTIKNPKVLSNQRVVFARGSLRSANRQHYFFCNLNLLGAVRYRVYLSYFFSAFLVGL